MWCRDLDADWSFSLHVVGCRHLVFIFLLLFLRWRTKQNLDYCFLMMYAQSKGTYYVQVSWHKEAKSCDCARPTFFWTQVTWWCHTGDVTANESWWEHTCCLNVSFASDTESLMKLLHCGYAAIHIPPLSAPPHPAAVVTHAETMFSISSCHLDKCLFTLK